MFTLLVLPSNSTDELHRTAVIPSLPPRSRRARPRRHRLPQPRTGRLLRGQHRRLLPRAGKKRMKISTPAPMQFTRRARVVRSASACSTPANQLHHAHSPLRGPMQSDDSMHAARMVRVCSFQARRCVVLPTTNSTAAQHSRRGAPGLQRRGVQQLTQRLERTRPPFLIVFIGKHT
ncbi:hypothetical protein VPH35_051054 [Triticum aestivum]